MTLTVLVDLFKAALPLPDFTNGAAVGAWLGGMSPSLGQVIADMVTIFAKTGKIELELPSGTLVTAYIDMECDCDGKCKMIVTETLHPKAVPEAWGDGTILAWIKKLLPIIIQILPFFLAPKPEPTPVPPAPPVV